MSEEQLRAELAWWGHTNATVCGGAIWLRGFKLRIDEALSPVQMAAAFDVAYRTVREIPVKDITVTELEL